jgi:hypothetical protein
MLSWHVPYLGWTRLPADVSEFEITHFFSLRAEERGAVLTRYRDSLRLGAALQIGFLKMCGCRFHYSLANHFSELSLDSARGLISKRLR